MEMILAVSIFVIAYIFIATEKISKVAIVLSGAAAMVLIGATDAEKAFYNHETGIDWNVIFLLLGMMIIVGVIHKTGVFEFTKDTKFVVNGDFQKDAANALASKFEVAAGWKPETTTKAPISNFVQFKVDPNLKNEAYILDVNPTSIVISAKGNVGFLSTPICLINQMFRR